MSFVGFVIKVALVVSLPMILYRMGARENEG